MEEIEDISRLLGELKTKLEQVGHRVKDEEKHYENLKEEVTRQLNEKTDLEKRIIECENKNLCPYKIAFEQIRNKYLGVIQKQISENNFHFFLSYRSGYARKKTSVIDVIEAHTNIIENKRYCWLGKFYKERMHGGTYRELEPFGESMVTSGTTNVPSNLRKKVQERVKNGEGVFLYLYNPNPPKLRLHVANIVDFYFGDGKIPYEDDLESDLPHCAYVPDYYFQETRNCMSCKKRDEAKCRLRFISNFWFKIDRFQELGNIEEEFNNLVNCFTDDSINFAIPILYPLIVRQRTPKFYFDNLIKPISHSSDFHINIPTKEHGHTKLEEVKNLFKKLNEWCKKAFISVDLRSCTRPFSSKLEIQENPQNDEITVCLPSGYRRDDTSMVFIINLDKRTNPEQKKKVEEMIKSFPI